ncbi:PIG-L deacetylase family protein [Kribbella solani]|uniref:LmbE family N-acetylglucosaminyl deacetylase n=1 Tax=Kribbella solani TaxID=236067 RepID=A0A841DQD7_9ACTN|nr:PIG-L deacetylase family protein [Kribbella solani]MBB5980069.1 LmbE family N-acetylglucosaminyl deacetylase [Kribbella solani]
MTRALAVFAHPDDVDFNAAGTIAQWVRDGIEVSYLVVTRGEAGQGEPRETIQQLREAEQRAAAAAIGVKDVEFLDGYADGRLTVTLDLRREITRAIRLKRPERVMTSSPERTWRLREADHPDHSAVGEAAACAVYPDALNPYVHPELSELGTWSVPEVWFCEPPEPDHYVDITETFGLKVAALAEHRSQPGIEPESVRDRCAAVGAAGQLPAGRLAEAFTIVRRVPAG